MARKPPAPPSAQAGNLSPDSFEDTARTMLETALTLHAANLSLSCAEIEQPVAEICAKAKARGMQAETLLIELKQIWHAVPESASHEKAEVIARLVSICIPEFYRTSPGSSRNS
jgi:hypothetical protein